jgi:hypothetical protein
VRLPLWQPRASHNKAQRFNPHQTSPLKIKAQHVLTAALLPGRLPLAQPLDLKQKTIETRMEVKDATSLHNRCQILKQHHRNAHPRPNRQYVQI